MEMTAAYAAMAADVKKITPFGVRAIRGTGRQLYEHRVKKTPRSQATLPWKRDEMIDLLVNTVDQGTGKAARLSAPVAGKTGTTQDYRDAWFIGFTNDIIVGIWLGNDDNAPMDRVSGGDLPARIWRDYITSAYRLDGATPKLQELLAGVQPIPEPDLTGVTPANTDETGVTGIRKWLRSFID